MLRDIVAVLTLESAIGGNLLKCGDTVFETDVAGDPYGLNFDYQ